MDAEDNDLLLICADNEGLLDLFLRSCMTFVSCVREQSEGSGSGKSVMLHSSLNPIKSRRGPNGCFYVFSVLAALLLGVVWPAAR